MNRPVSATRQRIIDSTRQIISEGEMNPSMTEIAIRAKVSKSALYYFFQNKKEILVATLRMIPAGVKELIVTVARKKIPADQKLHEVLEQLSKSIEREDAVSQLLVQLMFAHDEEVLATVLHERNTSLKALTSIINQGVEEKVFRDVDPRLTAEIIAGFLDFLMMGLSLPIKEGDLDHDCDPVQKCDQLYRLILR